MFLEVVDDSGDKGGLGTGDEKIEVSFLGETDEGGEVFLFEGGNIGDFLELGGPSVTGDHEDVGDERGLGEFPGDGVLAAAIANEENTEAGG